MKEDSEKNQVREDGPAKKAKKVAGEIGEKPEKCGHRSQQKSVSRRRRCSGPLKCCSEMSRKVAPCPPHLSSGSLPSKAFPDHLLQRALPAILCQFCPWIFLQNIYYCLKSHCLHVYSFAYSHRLQIISFTK